MDTLFSKKLRLLLFCIVVLSGCATTQRINSDVRDPLESTNRIVYGFNKGVDQAILHPLGELYQAITPDFLDGYITNFFSNIGEVSVISNDVLQLKIDQAFSDIMRFVTNSTVGILGIFDVATSVGLEKHDEDFGQTLGHWGFGAGPYIVMPLLGPLTIRDALGFAVDSVISPIGYLQNGVDMGLISLKYVDTKSDTMSTDQLIASASLDEYEFVKNAYFDKRRFQIAGHSDHDVPPDLSLTVPDEPWMYLLGVNSVDMEVSLMSADRLIGGRSYSLSGGVPRSGV